MDQVVEVRGQIEAWKTLRDKADTITKNTLKTQFPHQYGYSDPKKACGTSCISEIEVGRALWAYARSDLMIKSFQIKQLIKK